jgi:hypothetical protein
MTTKSRNGKSILIVAVLILVALAVLLVLPRVKPNIVPDTTSSTPREGFKDQARAAGITFHMSFLPSEQGENFKINLYDHGCGVAVGDYDGDGYEDVYFCNQLGRNALYRNKGDGTFEDVTEKAGVGLGDRVSVAATFADYDNDGHLDLFVTSTRGGNVLFRNMGNGTFKDVTKDAKVTHVGHSQTAVFFDYDNDGYLDLLVTNTAKWTLNDYNKTQHYFPGVGDIFDLAGSTKEYNILYHNNGDGTFTDVTKEMGLQGKGWGGDVAVFDFNGDGYLDVLITNMFGASQLYKNDHGKKFIDVTRETLVRTSFGAIGCKVFDFNNDGLLDLIIVDMHSDMWMRPEWVPSKFQEHLKKKFPKILGLIHELEPGKAAINEQKWADSLGLHYDDVVFGNTLFKQSPQGKFKEISDKAGMETWWPWGVVTGDFDNDGFEDVFLPSGMGYPYSYWPNALMMNNGNETFTDRAAEFGIEPPALGEYSDVEIRGRKAARSSRCAAVADFDGDGRLDIMVNNFNDHPYYFRNHFPKKNYIAFKLQGTKSNRDAIGAVARLYTGSEVMTRQVNPAGGYLSHSSKILHFGLGDRTKVDKVEITWPRGRKQTIAAPQINQRHPVIEPND